MLNWGDVVRRTGAVCAAAALLVSVATGCTGTAVQVRSAPGKPLPEIAQPVLDERGTVITSTDLTDLTDGLLEASAGARQAVYRSVSAWNGASSEVSGTFFVPKGTPPAGGWPVISYAHGTTGLTPDCGPSLHPDLLGYASAIAGLVKGGFAVAFTDYQGLGHPSVHPYLEPRTAAFNMIDAVRALRTLYPDVSERWLAVGGSQGGQASWAANEYARDYGAGLDLVGSIALAPAADVSGLADAAWASTLTPSQIVIMPLVLAGLHATHPDLNESDFLRGPAATYQPMLMQCSEEKKHIFSELTADQVRPASPEAAQKLTELLTENRLPQRPLTAPMLVINGDADDLILPQWISAAVSRACNMGGVIEHQVLKGQGHTDLKPTDNGAGWTADRFAGKAASSTCSS